MLYVLSVFCSLFSTTSGRGLLLLYRPRDISTDCAFSQHLRYDLSFGMGMSDTITLVFRTMSEVDYECGVEITTEYRNNIYILVVIRFPNSIGLNCLTNPDAFTVLKKEDCLRLCDQVAGRDIYSAYFAVSVRSRIRFRFASNSSINSDMNANLYEVTATSARRIDKGKPCNRINETICVMGANDYCFTSGVVCDGIKNCGVTDWFDERKSECEVPIHRLGYTPVIAVAAAILCAAMAATHILLRFLPPLANSFFIFNANEDNRLCIDPVFRPPGNPPCEIERVKNESLIPVFSSSSSDEGQENNEQSNTIAEQLAGLNMIQVTTFPMPEEPVILTTERKATMRSMTEKIRERFRSVTGRAKTITSRRRSSPSQKNINI